MNLNVIYEDNHLILVIKPCGIPVQKDSSKDDDLQSMIKNYLKKKYSKPGKVFLAIVHRLDRPVGGVMVFAKTSKAASRLSDQIRQNKWKKKYMAVIDGRPEKKSDILVDYLLKDHQNNIVKTVKEGVPRAKKAILSYEVLKNGKKRSILNIDLETGRSHQIRVQLSSRNWPIVNDHKYNPVYERGKDIALWSSELTVIHPVSGELLTFKVNPPEYFEKLIKN